MERKTKEKKSRPINATIIFADMVDSSMLSHIHEPSEYDSLVSEFHNTAAQVIKETVRKEHFEMCEPHVELSIRGDELCLILGCTKYSAMNTQRQCHPNKCVWTALQVAIRLKRRWLLSEVNKRRINDNGQPPLGIAIGIHSGPVVVNRHTRFSIGRSSLFPRAKALSTAEGYAINIAKRVETISRFGRFSQIFLTRPIYNMTPSDFRPAFVRVETPELKGIPVKPIIYEAKGVGHFDDKLFPNSPEFKDGVEVYYDKVVTDNPDEIWLLLDLAHWHFDKGQYDDAARMYKAVLEVDPSFAPAYTYLGRAYFRSYRLPAARTALERSLQLDPGQARTNHFLAVCLRREALKSWYEGQKEIAKHLFKRSIEHHQTACRITELEKMDYPWAQNGLILTVAQSFETDISDEVLIRPFDLDTALKNINNLISQTSNTVGKMGKEHLLLHTKAVVLLQKKKYANAYKTINEALNALYERKKRKRGIPPDDKAYADKCAEMLFHRGRCALYLPGKGIGEASKDWRLAKEILLKPWKRKEDQNRVIDSQYWIIFCKNYLKRTL